MYLDDTIVAISSPPGAARRGIVRLSGPRAREIAGTVFHRSGQSPEALNANVVVDGIVLLAGAPLPARAYYFFTPRSYTRQDIVELHLLGAPVVLGLLVEACLAAGARRAEPGEFTARAFLAGALDFSQVHGIAGMIAARSDHQLRASERLLHGDLSRTALESREELADLLSLVEGAMDFADEPIEFISPAELRAKLNRIHSALSATVSAGLHAERWGRLLRVVLVGRPNVGKSSLLNRLTGLDRAICTAIAGTTRDAIAAPLTFEDGTECLLVDVAGVEDGRSELDHRAQQTARAAVRDADLVLEVIDAHAPESSGISPPGMVPRLCVANKVDLTPNADEMTVRSAAGLAMDVPLCLVSAMTGDGCEDLRKRIAQHLQTRGEDSSEAAIALMAEHRGQLQAALDAIETARNMATGVSLAGAELIAAELRTAADALGALVGCDQPEELLGRIFSRFCVGK